MEIVIQIIAKQETYRIGKLYIDGKYFCDTLEDKDRGLTQDMSLEQIQKIKVYGETAIPVGKYKIDMDTVSPRFKDKSWAKVCDGKLPRLIDVPGYSGVLIHVGNSDKDSSGCILVGQNKVKGQVINSTVTFTELYKLMKAAHDAKEDITIEIK